MTLHKHNGQWSLGKIGILAGILASIATCILALPIAVDYCKSAIAPWTSLPAKVDALQNDVTDIKKIIEQNEYYEPSSNHITAGRGTGWVSPKRD